MDERPRDAAAKILGLHVQQRAAMVTCLLTCEKWFDTHNVVRLSKFTTRRRVPFFMSDGLADHYANHAVHKHRFGGEPQPQPHHYYEHHEPAMMGGRAAASDSTSTSSGSGAGSDSDGEMGGRRRGRRISQAFARWNRYVDAVQKRYGGTRKEAMIEAHKTWPCAKLALARHAAPGDALKACCKRSRSRSKPRRARGRPASSRSRSRSARRRSRR